MAASEKTGPLYLCRPEPRRGASFEELSLDEPALEPSLEELSLDETSLDEEDELSDFDLSSGLSLDPESPPDDPGEDDFFA